MASSDVIIPLNQDVIKNDTEILKSEGDTLSQNAMQTRGSLAVNDRTSAVNTCDPLYGNREERKIDKTSFENKMDAIQEMNRTNPMGNGCIPYNYEDKTQELIMNLTKWGLGSRKKIKRNVKNYTQSIFSKENLALLHEVRQIGEANKEATGFEFAYATWNNGLLMKVNGTCKRFGTVDEAMELLGLSKINVVDNEEGYNNNNEEQAS